MVNKRKKSKGSTQKKLELSQCYLCGKICDTPSIDHIPPWCLAPNSPQSSFIQLPACKKCNNSYQIKENHFRDFTANVAHGSGNLAADAAYEKYKRWTEKEYERLGRPNKDLQRIIDSSDPAIHIDMDGKILGTSTIFRDGPDFFTKEIFIKIARGIHYHHTKIALLSGHHIYIYRVNYIQFLDYTQAASNLFYGKQGDFFEYIGGYEENDPACGIWALSLYSKITFVVSFEREGRKHSILRSPLDIQHSGAPLLDKVSHPIG